MNREHTEYLFKHFPSFFNPRAPLRDSLMAFGFECGDGWFELIKELCEKLEVLQLKNFEVIQVKEKFGGLRFYYSIREELERVGEIDHLIDEAGGKSYKTCETCGKPGKSEDDGWITTLCPACRENREKSKMDKKAGKQADKK